MNMAEQIPVLAWRMDNENVVDVYYRILFSFEDKEK